MRREGEVTDQAPTIPALPAPVSETEVKKPLGNSALATGEALSNHSPAEPRTVRDDSELFEITEFGVG